MPHLIYSFGWGRVLISAAWLKWKLKRDMYVLHKDSFCEYVLICFPRDSNSWVCSSFLKFSSLRLFYFYFFRVWILLSQTFIEEKLLTFFPYFFFSFFFNFQDCSQLETENCREITAYRKVCHSESSTISFFKPCSFTCSAFGKLEIFCPPAPYPLHFF